MKVNGTNSSHKKITIGRFVKLLFPKLDFETRTVIIDENSKVLEAREIENCLGQVQELEPALPVSLEDIPELKNSVKISSFRDADTGKVS